MDVFVDERKVFTGLFFQNSMKYNFNCFPKVMFFDATYKLNELSRKFGSGENFGPGPFFQKKSFCLE